MKPRLIRMVAMNIISSLKSRGYEVEGIGLYEDLLCEIIAEFFALHLEKQILELREINEVQQ